MRSLAVIQCRESRVVEMTSPKASSYLRQLTAQSGSRGRLTLYKGGSCLLASRRQITQCARARANPNEDTATPAFPVFHSHTLLLFSFRCYIYASIRPGNLRAGLFNSAGNLHVY